MTGLAVCPGCGGTKADAAPACIECWRAAPAHLRMALSSARHTRVSDPAGYGEAVVGFLQWCADRRYREDDE